MVKIIVSLAVFFIVVFSCFLTWKQYITHADNWKVLIILLMAYWIYIVW